MPDNPNKNDHEARNENTLVPEWLKLKNRLDALDQGTFPRLEQNYPPHGAPLFWDEFKAWATENMSHLSLAVQDEKLLDPVTSECLRCYRAGRVR